MKVRKLLGIVVSVFLFFAGCASTLLFGLGLLLDTRAEKRCCTTLLSCYHCENPPAPPYWPLFVALALFVACGLLLRASLRRRGGAN